MTIGGTDISRFTVVCQSDAPAAVFAVSELRRYIEMETGAALEVSDTLSGEHRIIVECGGDEDGEGFSVRTSGGDLIIRGDGPRGALYGVYDFLERCAGWRFLASDTDYLLPAEKIELAGLDYSESPAIYFRDVFWKPYFDAGISAKRRINANDKGLRDLTPELGGGIGFTGDFVHTFASLCECGPDVQPCLSDPKTYETALKNVMALLDANPGARYISVSQNDNSEYCRCPECQRICGEEGSPSGQILRFVNRIADEVAKKYPKVTIYTLAYRYSRKPPKLTIPRPNVRVQLCSIECCYKHPFCDPDCADNAEFARDLCDWSKICKNMSIWDYTVNYRYYLAPFPNFGVMAENMSFLAKNNVKSVFCEGLYSGAANGEFGALRCYLLSKLLWNPDMTREEYDSAARDFLRGYYGEGWESVSFFLELLMPDRDKPGCFGIYDHPFLMVDRELFAANIVGLDRRFDEAEALAGDERTLEHVRNTRLCFTFLKLCARHDAGEASAEYDAECRALRDAIVAKGVRYNEGVGAPGCELAGLSPADWS